MTDQGDNCDFSPLDFPVYKKSPKRPVQMPTPSFEKHGSFESIYRNTGTDTYVMTPVEETRHFETALKATLCLIEELNASEIGANTRSIRGKLKILAAAIKTVTT